MNAKAPTNAAASLSPAS